MNNEEYVLIPLSVFESKEWAEKREFSKAEAWIWLLVNANRTNFADLNNTLILKTSYHS